MEYRYSVELFIRSKIQFFESKSQHTMRAYPLFDSCLSDQRYNFLKANHNFSEPLHVRVVCCLSDQRYNFLKANHNLQTLRQTHLMVVYQIKDTIFWKQITTPLPFRVCCRWLFIRSKIQFFESKSQQYARYCPRQCVVYQIKDTIFWKQITTTNYTN